MAKEQKAKKQPAKDSQQLFKAHSSGLKQLAKEAHQMVRNKARAEWHRTHKPNETN